MPGVWFTFPCSVCGDEAHPNAPLGAMFRPYLHLYEQAGWKPTPKSGWKTYDHRAKR